MLRKNICNSFSKVFPNLIINEITQAQRPFNRSTYISHKAYDHSFPARYSDLPRVAQHNIYQTGYQAVQLKQTEVGNQTKP